MSSEAEDVASEEDRPIGQKGKGKVQENIEHTLVPKINDMREVMTRTTAL